MTAASITLACVCTSKIVSAFVANSHVASDELPNLIRAVHAACSEILRGETPQKPRPAAPIDKSVQNDFIVCLEDGKKLKLLKRCLRTTYGLTPDAYRQRWGLPRDYPMVAPSYARHRSACAKRIGLGKGVRKASPLKS